MGKTVNEPMGCLLALILYVGVVGFYALAGWAALQLLALVGCVET